MASDWRVGFATTFLRYWGANMERYVWALGHEWPGFGYDAEDQALLVRWGQTVGSSFVLFVLGAVVIFLVLATAIVAVVWGPILASDPATTSAITFFVGLGAACILSITVALPLAMLAAASLASLFAPPFAPPEDERQHGLRVYRVVLGQIRRVGIVGGILVPIGSILMLTSATFDRVVSMLATTLPWIVLGVVVLEGLIRLIPRPGARRAS